MEVVHIIHSFGELNETIAVFANSLFAISLLHGGVHFVKIHVRRRRIERARVRVHIDG